LLISVRLIIWRAAFLADEVLAIGISSGGVDQRPRNGPQRVWRS
jgi:hypothetical protein